MIHHLCFPLEIRRSVSGTSESVATARSLVTSGLIGSLAFTHLWLSLIPLRNKWAAITGLFMQQRGETEATFPFYVVDETASHTFCYTFILSLFLSLSAIRLIIVNDGKRGSNWFNGCFGDNEIYQTNFAVWLGFIDKMFYVSVW